MSTKITLITTHLILSILLCLIHFTGFLRFISYNYFKRNYALGAFWLISIILCALTYKYFFSMVAHLVVTLIVLLPYISGKRNIDYNGFTGFSGLTKLISLAVCISIIVFARREEDELRGKTTVES